MMMAVAAPVRVQPEVGALSAACCFAAPYVLLHPSWGSTYHHAACMQSDGPQAAVCQLALLI
jgi:hypothetical protein